MPISGFPRKAESPAPNRARARPAVTCSARSVTASTAWTSARAAPASIAMATPIHALCVATPTAKEHGLARQHEEEDQRLDHVGDRAGNPGGLDDEAPVEERREQDGHEDDRPGIESRDTG